MQRLQLLIFALLAGCSSSTDATGAADIRGVYTLASIGGRSMPTTFDGTMCSQFFETGNKLTLGDNAKASVQGNSNAGPCVAGSVAALQTYTAAYSTRGDSIFLTLNLNGRTYGGSLANGIVVIPLPNFRLSDATQSFRFQKTE
jgi:hypothetical protein